MLGRKKQHEQKKHERRLLARQLRANKRQEALSRRRALGTASTPPFLVAVVSLHAEAAQAQAVTLLATAETEATVSRSPQGLTHIR